MKSRYGSLLLVVCFFSFIYGMDGTKPRPGVLRELSGHRRVQSAGDGNGDPSEIPEDIQRVMAGFEELKDEVAQRRARRRSESFSEFAPIIEVDPSDAHPVEDPYEQTGTGSDSDGSDSSSQTSGISTTSISGEKGSDRELLDDSLGSSVSSGEISFPSDFDPLNYLLSDEDSDGDDPFQPAGAYHSPSESHRPAAQRAGASRGSIFGGVIGRMTYRKMLGCAVGIYVISEVVKSLLSQSKQERKKNTASDEYTSH